MNIALVGTKTMHIKVVDTRVVLSGVLLPRAVNMRAMIMTVAVENIIDLRDKVT
jgi:hypothetical protein